ncbi:PDZ domain-containing protein [Chryseobacterium sp. A301]
MKWIRLLFLLLASTLFSQSHFQLLGGKSKIEIPFQLINNLIFIPVTVNGVELTFLLDSGINETLLFSLENKDVDFNQVEKMRFSGLGDNVQIEGLLAVNNRVQIGENLVDLRHRIYLILDEEFNFSSHVGIPVNGIIGYHFFKDHVVKIDYVRKKITLYDPSDPPKLNRRYSSLDLSIELNKPYVQAGIEQTRELTDSKMLIDLGNSDALWLFPSVIPGFEYNRPNIDDFLGRGFSGDIYGKRSRIHRLVLAGHELLYPLTAMPDEFSIQHLKLVADRKGSVGSETLRRFTVVLNYPEKTISLKRNKFFSDPFHFNMSGLDIKHDGMFWGEDLVKVESQQKPTSSSRGDRVYTAPSAFQYRFVLKPEYSISGSRPDSPAYIAGLRKGDKILSINGKKASTYSLKQIFEVLKSEAGRKITFEIERDYQVQTIFFYLEDPIPYRE